MDTRAVEERHLAAGREYEKNLVSLGLEPHALMWAFDEIEGRFVLILVTDFFDLKGPLEISRQLFKAYNSSKTPKEIDPFTVRVHSINQPFGGEVHDMASSDRNVRILDNNLKLNPDVEGAHVASWRVGGLLFRPEWLIAARKIQPRKSVEIIRRWDRFERNVNKRAA